MPTRAYAAGSVPSPGTNARTLVPKAWPSIAPRNSVGVKTPPTVPEPTARGVTTRRSRSSASTCPAPQGRSKSAPIASRPLPTISGYPRVTTPRASPASPIAIGRGRPRSLEQGRARAQGEEEQGRDHPAQDAQPRVEPDLPRARQGEGRHVEDGVVAEARPAQERGRGRGDGERREGLEREAAEDDLHREEGRPERRVVGARETGRDAAADEHPKLAGWNSEDTARAARPWRRPRARSAPRGRPLRPRPGSRARTSRARSPSARAGRRCAARPPRGCPSRAPRRPSASRGRAPRRRRGPPARGRRHGGGVSRGRRPAPGPGRATAGAAPPSPPTAGAPPPHPRSGRPPARARATRRARCRAAAVSRLHRHPR